MINYEWLISLANEKNDEKLLQHLLSLNKKSNISNFQRVLDFYKIKKKVLKNSIQNTTFRRVNFIFYPSFTLLSIPIELDICKDNFETIEERLLGDDPNSTIKVDCIESDTRYSKDIKYKILKSPKPNKKYKSGMEFNLKNDNVSRYNVLNFRNTAITETLNFKLEINKENHSIKLTLLKSEEAKKENIKKQLEGILNIIIDFLSLDTSENYCYRSGHQ